MTVETNIALDLLWDLERNDDTNNGIKDEKDRIKFKYAQCTIRGNKKKYYQFAYDCLNSLYKNSYYGYKTGYLLYMALASMKMKKYDLAIQHCKSALELESYDEEMIRLMTFIRSKKKNQNSLVAFKSVCLLFILVFFFVKYLRIQKVIRPEMMFA